MAYESLLGLRKDTRHKIFISYYHKDDEYYRYQFEQSFGHLFISKSVQPGDINSDVSADYIKRLIQMGYITDASVVVILVGPKTYCRKHVDWEISAGLNKKVGGYSGLLGILLPQFPLTSEGKYHYEDIPSRLADNVKSGYAKIYRWDWLCDSESNVTSAIEDAFQDRIIKTDKINNSSTQFVYNRCD